MMQITYEIPSKISDMNKTYLKEADTFLHTPVATHVRFNFMLYTYVCAYFSPLVIKPLKYVNQVNVVV